jgi:peptidoglycan/LPS O-acetylase OafA/YrhL
MVYVVCDGAKEESALLPNTSDGTKPAEIFKSISDTEQAPNGSAIDLVVNHDADSESPSIKAANGTTKLHGNEPDKSKRAFRADLQGLRSMAAILIAMGHIWTPSASGGVGVFYFVGGFFVIGSLHRKCSTTGQLEIGKFLEHTFSRIVPEAYAAIVLIALLVCMWLSPMDRAENLTDGVSSALFLTNWWFRYKNTDYLARDANLSPYLLFWSLADIVQIYAMNAVVYWVLTKCVPKPRLDAAGISWLLFQVAASFLYLLYLLSTGRYETAYFETPLWVWMFAAGALTSLFANKLRVTDTASTALCVAASLLIVTVCSCILFLGVVPTQLRFGLFCAAVMVVIAGETSTPSTLLSLIFGNRVFVHLGNNSYFIFLLHWPIVLAYIQMSGHWSSSFLRGTTILAITLVLAEVCSRLFSWLRSCALHKPSIQCMLLWVPINLILLQVAFSQASSTGPSIGVSAVSSVGGSVLHPGALVLAARVFDAAPVPNVFMPRPDKAWKDTTNVYRLPQCNTGVKQQYRCSLGALGSNTVIALMGASHVAQWSPAMEALADRYGWELQVHSLASCDFYDTPTGPTCSPWLADTTAQLQQTKPTFLFVLGTQAKEGDTERPMHERANSFYATMRKAGTIVVALRDNPRARWDIPRCVEANLDGNYQEECSPSHSFYNNAVMMDIIASGVHDAFIDTASFFCDETSCPAVIGNVLVYQDKYHITATYMHTLVPLLERKLRVQVPSLFTAPSKRLSNGTAPSG